MNGQRLLGLNHVDVVAILKDLPQHVRIVCARRKNAQNAEFVSSTTTTTTATEQRFQPTDNVPTAQSGTAALMTDRLVKAKSEQALPMLGSGLTPEGPLNKAKSRSLEPLTGLAMWSSDLVVIELVKGDRGLGFSILDYQVSTIIIILER